MLIGFDLDGTLLDSRARHGVALQRAGSGYNVHLSADQISQYLKIKRDGSNGLEALQTLKIPKARGIHAKWIEIIESQELLELDTLYPDTLTVLRRTKSVVVTSRQNAASAKAQVERLNILNLFDDFIVIPPQLVKAAKASASRKYSFDAIVGDTEVDLQWGKDLRVPFYASSFGFRSEAFWKARNVRSYSSLAELLAVAEEDLFQSNIARLHTEPQ